MCHPSFKLFTPYNRKSYAECGTRELWGRVRRCKEGLESACSVLPRMDADGHSDCPFASKLFAAVQDWMEESHEQRRQLCEHRDEIHAAMEESKRKKRDAGFDEDPRHVNDADMYEAEYRKHREWHKQVIEEIKALDEALAQAAATIAERRAS